MANSDSFGSQQLLLMWSSILWGSHTKSLLYHLMFIGKTSLPPWTPSTLLGQPKLVFLWEGTMPTKMPHKAFVNHVSSGNFSTIPMQHSLGTSFASCLTTLPVISNCVLQSEMRTTPIYFGTTLSSPIFGKGKLCSLDYALPQHGVHSCNILC